MRRILKAVLYLEIVGGLMLGLLAGAFASSSKSAVLGLACGVNCGGLVLLMAMTGVAVSGAALLMLLIWEIGPGSLR